MLSFLITRGVQIGQNNERINYFVRINWNVDLKWENTYNFKPYDLPFVWISAGKKKQGDFKF